MLSVNLASDVVRDQTMRLLPSSPEIPSYLLERYGQPEEVFAPNSRFRFASFLLGVLLLLLGLAFVLWAWDTPKAQAGGSGGILLLLGGGLMTVGTAAIVFPRSVPLNWIFVCPQGLVRTLGSDWEGVDWNEIVCFEDVSLSSGAVTIRQCRLVTTAGQEWGFLADSVADYGRLAAILRRKVEAYRSPEETRN